MSRNSQLICPLCGKDNACALAAGNAASQCWCQDVRLDADVLQQLPVEELGKRCICRHCGELKQEKTSEG